MMAISINNYYTQMEMMEREQGMRQEEYKRQIQGLYGMAQGYQEAPKEKKQPKQDVTLLLLED